MTSIADLLQAAQSSLPVILLATVISFIGYVGRGWIDSRAVAVRREKAAREAAAEAAAQASAAVRIANIEDQAKMRAEANERIRDLEDRWDRAQRECQQQIAQLQSDCAKDTASLRAEHATAIAEVQASAAQGKAAAAQQLATVHAENAAYKERVANLEEDNRMLWEKVEGLLDISERAAVLQQAALHQLRSASDNSESTPSTE